LDEDYTIIKEIGEGNSAKVFLVEDLGSHKKFAVKNISKAYLHESPMRITSLVSEIDIMREISHHHIISLHKVYESSSTISLVMDYLPAGDFFQRLQHKNRFPEAVAAHFMTNLLEALRYLHAKHITHRDLKPENILMTSKDNDFDFKICDLGLSCISKDEQILRCGSPGYIAPEILNRQPYSNKVDVFSSGAILYILLCGNSPFRGKDAYDVLRKNKECKIKVHKKPWNRVSDLGIDFVKRLMDPDPRCRLSADEALRHPWICKYENKGSFGTIITPTTMDVGASVDN
jgi:calcium-dependent protein kinase